MAVKGQKALQLAYEVLRQVEMQFPLDVDVGIAQRGSIWFFERHRSDGGSGSPILSFGTPVPMPRHLGAKLAAIDAVQTLLILGYGEPHQSHERMRKQLEVTATVDGALVRVTYLQPGDGARVEIAALPLALL